MASRLRYHPINGDDAARPAKGSGHVHPPNTRTGPPAERIEIMLRWAIVFFVLSLIAGFLGFGGVQSDLAWIGKILVFVFLVLFVVSLVMGRSGPPAV